MEEECRSCSVAQTVESAMTLGAIGICLVGSIAKFGALKTGLGLIAFDLLVAGPLRRRNKSD